MCAASHHDAGGRRNTNLVCWVVCFQAVWNLVMRKRLDVLADHLVDFPGYERTREQKLALLKARLRPIARTNWNTTPSLARKRVLAADAGARAAPELSSRP
mgnify:CR=1 FL=1